MMPSNLATRLGQRLAGPLPGRAGQRRFAPQLSYGRHYGPPAPDVRQAAVLVLLYPDQGQWYLPMTLRPDHMADHAGQICLPGGGLDPGETPEQGALRELHEELGVPASQVHLLGRLSPLYVFASNFLVTPCVATAAGRPQFHPHPGEVAEVLEIPLHALLDPRHYGTHEIHRQGLTFSAPHIAYQGHRIWGASSMILGELIELME